MSIILLDDTLLLKQKIINKCKALVHCNNKQEIICVISYEVKIVNSTFLFKYIYNKRNEGLFL